MGAFTAIAGLITRAPLLSSGVALLAGLALAGGGTVAWDHLVVLPHALELQKVEITTSLTDTFEKAAAKAKADQQLAYQTLLMHLTQQMSDQQLADETAHQADLLQLNQRIADYEKGDTDAACRFDQSRLDFLLGPDGPGGVRAQP